MLCGAVVEVMGFCGYKKSDGPVWLHRFFCVGWGGDFLDGEFVGAGGGFVADGADDHACGDGVVGHFVDEDEAAGGAVE